MERGILAPCPKLFSFFLKSTFKVSEIKHTHTSRCDIDTHTILFKICSFVGSTKTINLVYLEQ